MDQENEESDLIPIDTLELAAILVSGCVIQGRIEPTSKDDLEAEMLLAHLGILVEIYEQKILSETLVRKLHDK